MSSFKSSNYKSETSLYENFIQARKIRIKYTNTKKNILKYICFLVKIKPEADRLVCVTAENQQHNSFPRKKKIFDL